MDIEDYTTESIEVRHFETFVPLEKSVTNHADGDVTVSGPVASEQKDIEGDTMVRTGIWKSLTDYMGRYGGHVDWEHQYVKTHDAKDIIGQAIKTISVNGRPYLASRLFGDHPMVPHIVRLIKKGAHIGYSVLGTGIRDRSNGTVMSTSIKFVTLAPIPMGIDQFMQIGLPENGIVQISKALCDDTARSAALESRWHAPSLEELNLLKSLTVGSGIVGDGASGGAALRVQQIGTGPKECGCTKSKKCKKHAEKSDTGLEPVTALEKAFRESGIKDFRQAAIDFNSHLKMTRN